MASKGKQSKGKTGSDTMSSEEGFEPSSSSSAGAGAGAGGRAAVARASIGSANVTGPTYGVPPVIIGEPFRIWGLTLSQIFAIIIGSILAIVYLVLIPVPDNFELRAIVAVVIVVFCWMLARFQLRANKTSLEWAISYLAFLMSNIPRHTKAREPVASASASSNRSRYASVATLSADYLAEVPAHTEQTGSGQN